MKNTSVTALYHIEIQKLMLYITGHLERHEVVKIEERVGIFHLRKLATGHHRRGPEAGRATNQQSIHHVRPWDSQFSMKNTPRGRRNGNTAESQKLKKAGEYLGSAKKPNYGTIVERYLEDEQHQMHMYEQGSTQSDMKEIDRVATEKEDLRRFLTERALYRDQHKVVQPYQGGGSDTVKTEEHPECEHIVQWKSENMTRQSSVPDAEQWSSWSSWTWSRS